MTQDEQRVATALERRQWRLARQSDGIQCLAYNRLTKDWVNVGPLLPNMQAVLDFIFAEEGAALGETQDFCMHCHHDGDACWLSTATSLARNALSAATTGRIGIKSTPPCCRSTGSWTYEGTAPKPADHRAGVSLLVLSTRNRQTSWTLPYA